jgi:T-complex protein 1 subunit alpha
MDDLALKYMVEAGVMGVRRVKPSELRTIAKATGATVLLSLGDMEAGESFDPSCLGTAELVDQVPISDQELIMIRGCANISTSSIVLRGANTMMLDEMERSVHDALCVVKRTLESQAVVPGGGCVEAALSVYLQNFATTLGSLEQLAITQFAASLLVIPKALSVNAAQDATDLTAKLVAHHYKSQTIADKKHLWKSGLNLRDGRIQNNVDLGILEPITNKLKCLEFATEAAITILRIDDLISLNPEPQQAQPQM